jgi:quinol monooxygenase YgiN
VQRWPEASHINLPKEATMYARLTTFRVKPDKINDMRRWRQVNEAAIYAQPGLRHWTGMMDEKGETYIVSVFDDERAARDSMSHARALWQQMAPMLEGEPTARFFDVLAVEAPAPRGVVMA